MPGECQALFWYQFGISGHVTGFDYHGQSHSLLLSPLNTGLSLSRCTDSLRRVFSQRKLVFVLDMQSFKYEFSSSNILSRGQDVVGHIGEPTVIMFSVCIAQIRLLAVLLHSYQESLFNVLSDLLALIP